MAIFLKRDWSKQPNHMSRVSAYLPSSLKRYISLHCLDTETTISTKLTEVLNEIEKRADKNRTETINSLAHKAALNFKENKMPIKTFIDTLTNELDRRGIFSDDILEIIAIVETLI